MSATPHTSYKTILEFRIISMCTKIISVVAKIIPKNRGKQTPELRIDSRLLKSLSETQKWPSRSPKWPPESSKMTFGASKKMTFEESKMSSRELQNDLRSFQTELRKSSRIALRHPVAPRLFQNSVPQKYWNIEILNIEEFLNIQYWSLNIAMP